jgi:probable phosphoglycerate mutase
MSGASDSFWPDRLWLVRHGQSAGNVARDAAYAEKKARIDISQRDVDVPLSELGKDQSAALGRWFAELPADERPEVILSSPYVRAVNTAQIIVDRGGLAGSSSRLVVDERLREREFGILDGLTHFGIQQLHPEQWEIRRALGKFYHRPPGGESWCDVILRLRSALNTLSLHYRRQRVLIVGHEVVILCFRYLIEAMTEAQVLKISAEGDVANCGITEYERVSNDGEISKAMRLVRCEFTAPLERENATVTSDSDVKSAAP